MIGQLDWDGVVLPMEEVSWESLIETAGRLQGLDINEEFFVTYKDEEGDVINVKNENDLHEAIRWAEEQGVPCLCMHVPFPSAESDSDESWTEIDNGSPRGKTVVVDSERSLEVPDDEAEPEQSELARALEETHDEVDQSETDANRESEIQPDEQNVEEEEQVQKPIADEEPQMQTAFTGFEAEPIAKVEAIEVTPILSVFEEVAKDIAAGEGDEHESDLSDGESVQEEEEEEEEGVKVSSTPIITIDRLIEMLYAANEAEEETVSDKEMLLSIFKDTESVREIAEMLSHPAVQNAVVTIAKAEADQAGSAMKVASTQMLKLMYQTPDVFSHLNRIANFEQVVPRVLRKLKGQAVRKVSASEAAKVLHPLVLCDGCQVNADQREVAMATGHRNEDGHIMGVRYKSAVVPNYDICESCEASGLFQGEAGPFLKIVDPASAPEVILCALPGTSAGMASRVDSLDWRNPLAREFLDFVESRRQRAFPQQRNGSQQQQQQQRPEAPETPKAVECTAAVAIPSAISPAPVVPEIKCKHLLKTFETAHPNFSCDICSVSQKSKVRMHGCRVCNFDVCETCFAKGNLPVQVEAPLVVQPTTAATTTPVALPPIPMPIAIAPAPVAAAVQAPPPPVPQAKFVSDLTLADGCVVRPGEYLVKTWRVRNSGMSRWAPGTRIGHVGGDAFGGPIDGVEVPLANPGEAVNISVPLTMPMNPGRYTSYWRMMTPHPENGKFGHRFWVTVNVVAPTPPPQVYPMASGVVIRPPPVPRLLSVPSGYVAGSPVLPPRVNVAPPPPPPPPPAPQPSAPQLQDPAVTPQLEEAVAQIIEFGFNDIDNIVRILKEVNCDAGAAIDRLLEES